jgi:hypothetical protein
MSTPTLARDTDAAKIRAKALAALREGRVLIAAVSGADMAWGRPPTHVSAIVLSSRGDHIRHVVDYSPDARWTCSCAPLKDDCAHIRAVRLVTGHTELAHRRGK